MSNSYKMSDIGMSGYLNRDDMMRDTRRVMDMQNGMTKLPFTEGDVWLIASAAENLRSAPGDDPKEQERRIEAAWRIAPKLDDLMRRMLAALKEHEGEKR